MIFDGGKCVCPGDTRIYQCPVIEGATTIWNGTAFNCPLMDNQILYKLNETVTGSCNNGSIMLRKIYQERNYYTSVAITITPETAGKTIECFSLFDGNYTHHLSKVIPNITGLTVIRIVLHSQPMICMQYSLIL